MNTILLDAENWDLTLDGSGNLAVASNPYSLAQDVASACRVFRGELWYDNTLGVPYYQQILGQRPSLQLVKSLLIAQGVTVPDVAAITCYLTGPDDHRTVGGQLQITDASGQVVGVAQTGSLAGELPWYISAVSYGASGAAT